MRISTWSRKASNTNTLVNMERWEQIKRKFPTEVANRVEGKTAMLLEESMARQKSVKQQALVSSESSSSDTNNVATSSKREISSTGEIRREYEESLRREQERLREEAEREEELSKNLINQLIVSSNRIQLNSNKKRKKTFS